MTDVELVTWYDRVKVRVRAAALWVYNWITVLTATVMGALSYGFDAFNAVLGSADITPLLPPESALKIVTGIAIAKGIVAYWQSRKAA